MFHEPLDFFEPDTGKTHITSSATRIAASCCRGSQKLLFEPAVLLRVKSASRRLIQRAGRDHNPSPMRRTERMVLDLLVLDGVLFGDQPLLLGDRLGQPGPPDTGGRCRSEL